MRYPLASSLVLLCLQLQLKNIIRRIQVTTQNFMHCISKHYVVYRTANQGKHDWVGQGFVNTSSRWTPTEVQYGNL
ncbi:hypothetical protein Y032_0180g818 [Ancylostoma ceylanicum]|uniref:Uncharacterized protein n=1 Tax=Ancylostoma ceylanicum TaxID=53326 RepID=A0A016STD3_9BILA|nr:hypothetical protein Y032_0180g818 [Ancylostoma ceylanicum]